MRDFKKRYEDYMDDLPYIRKDSDKIKINEGYTSGRGFQHLIPNLLIL